MIITDEVRITRQVGEVCYETKVARDINKMYEIRAELHSKVYQHRVANVVEAMVTDVFLEAEDAYRFRGEDGSPPVSLSHAARVPEHFAMLTDSILGDILRCPQPGLERARELLLRLMNRNHYEWLGNQPVQVPTQPTCNHQEWFWLVTLLVMRVHGSRSILRPHHQHRQSQRSAALRVPAGEKS